MKNPLTNGYHKMTKKVLQKKINWIYRGQKHIGLVYVTTELSKNLKVQLKYQKHPATRPSKVLFYNTRFIT